MSATALSEGTAAPETVVLPASGTPCQRRLDEKREWGRTLAVRTGPVVLGVRADTPDSAACLEQVLAPIRAREFDDQVSANFSVELGEDEQPRRLFLAYRAHQVVARRHDRSQLVEDLVHLLDDLPKAWSSQSLALSAGGLVTPEGEIVLLPADVHRTLLSRRRQLDEAGLGLLPGRTQLYDVTTGEIQVGIVDEGVAGALSALDGASVATRLPVSTWCLGVETEAPIELTGADAVVAAIGAVLNRERIGMGAALQGLRAAVLRHRMVAMPTLTAGAQARAVLALL